MRREIPAGKKRMRIQHLGAKIPLDTIVEGELIHVRTT